MTLTINGQDREVAAGATVADVIAQLGLGSGACAAEVNGTIVPKRQHAQTTLSEGDRLELVTLVGGG